MCDRLYLQLDQLGVGGGVGLNRLEGGGLVLDGLLGDGGHGVHSAEAETWKFLLTQSSSELIKALQIAKVHRAEGFCKMYFLTE